MSPEATQRITTETIIHDGEQQSNPLRRRATQVEPKAIRTFTRSLAVLAHSAGAYHWTPEGRRLMDFTSGVLVANLGHNSASWTRRFLGYLGWPCDGALPTSGYFHAAPLTAYNALTELEVQASERLIRSLQGQAGGGRLQQVLWAASGSEAVQKALWAAMKQRPGADQIIATRHGFHGKKGLAGAVTGSEHDAERDPRVHFVSFPMRQCGDLQRRRQALDLAPFRQELERLAEQLPGRIGCLITEPYLGGGGSYHPQPEYLQLLQAFCRRHDALFILDEVQSNFGRTGPMYAFTHYGVEPDIVCLGKGLGNGVAVSAAVGPSRVFGQMKYGEGSDTWSANPMASASVLATLDEFEHNDVLRQGQALSQVIEEGLTALLETPLVEAVRGEGCVWGVHCQAHGSATAEEVANRCVEACYLGDEQGRAIHLLGPLAGCVLRVSPPLTTPIDEAREHLAAMRLWFERVASELV